jgi:phosphoribosylaminoimidazole-succinocarboxamide synthase
MKRRKAMSILCEGKTKRILGTGGKGTNVVIEMKNTTIVGDGTEHEIQGKGAWSATTAISVFNLLEKCGIKTAYNTLDDTEFVCQKCVMIPYKIVVRREIHNLALKREPWLEEGHYLPQLRVEFYLKTSGKKWADKGLPIDNPYIDFHQTGTGLMGDLYLPDEPIWQQDPSKIIIDYPFFGDVFKAQVGKDVKHISVSNWKEHLEEQARRIFLILEKQWQILGKTLVDIELEFGFDSSWRIVLADTIDADSWHLLGDEPQQAYRKPPEVDIARAKHCRTAELSKRFGLPEQRLIIWQDQNEKRWPILSKEAGLGLISIADIHGQTHKEPVQSLMEIQRLTQEVPDSVLIVYYGAGGVASSVLSSHITIPTIAVPADWEKFPNDVWSSLRTPSNVPVSTILEPSNAALHAKQILALRNPQLYADLRYEQERYLRNL